MYILIIIRPKGRCARNRGGCVVLLSSSRGPLQRRAYAYRVTGAVKRQHVLYTTSGGGAQQIVVMYFKAGGSVSGLRRRGVCRSVVMKKLINRCATIRERYCENSKTDVLLNSIQVFRTNFRNRSFTTIMFPFKIISND